jgi:hypothetical protein
MENAHLWQITPRGTITHRWLNNDTTIDLAFATSILRDQLLHCKIAHDLDCESDHLPISVQFNWEWKRATTRKTRRWAATDVDKLRKVFQLGTSQMQLHDVDAPEKIDDLTTQLVQTLTKAINESTPWNNPSPRALPGFNEECKEARAETQRLRRKWQATRTEDDRKAYKKACNDKKKLISKHLKQAHRDKVTEAVLTPKNLWKIAKWAVNRHKSPAITTPSLTRADGLLETSPEGKAELLRASFFPPPVQADLDDIPGYDYPEPHHCPAITESEIERAI